MNVHVLIDDAEKFEGLYVGLSSFTERRVISSGSDPIKVYWEARNSGAVEPVIMFVPEKNVVNIY